MKIVNIYITTTDRKRLEELKWKYHVSYSTIANTCVMKLAKCIGNQCGYLYEEKGYKTSIKCKLEWELENISQLYTNCLKIFLKDEINKYVKEDNGKIKSSILNELNNTWEENWNGNYFNRLMPRLVKKNKSYYKKLLEVE